MLIAIEAIDLPNILPVPFHSAEVSFVSGLPADATCISLSGSICNKVDGTLSAAKATYPSFTGTGVAGFTVWAGVTVRVGVTGVAGTTLAAACAPKAAEAEANISSIKSTVFLRNLPLPRFSLVLSLFKQYLSVIHSSAVYFSGSRW